MEGTHNLCWASGPRWSATPCRAHALASVCLELCLGPWPRAGLTFPKGAWVLGGPLQSPFLVFLWLERVELAAHPLCGAKHATTMCHLNV